MRLHAERSPGEDPARAGHRGDTAAPEPPVLELQRRYGNAAVSRLLARQPLDEAAPTGPGPVRIERTDPLIRTVRGPTLHDHGGYEWYVTFQLPHPAEADGFLIQELWQESSAGGSEHFWECWRIRGGEREPGDRTDGYDDRYRNLNVPGAAQPATGWKRHVGVIRFYPGPLPREFGTEGSANFYLTWTQPAGWNGGGTRHDCYSEWNTATGANGLVAYAGSDELRTGSPVPFRPR